MYDFDRQPFLQDSVVTLRPLRADDWDALYAVASDPLLWAAHPAHDRWQEAKFRTFFDEGMASGGALAIVDAATNRIIGSSRYILGRAQTGEVEIGSTLLARSHWGGGANIAIKRLMLGHALATFDSVIFLIGEGNMRSRRAMEKIGGRRTDREYQAQMAGVAVRHLIYLIDRATFASGPLAGTGA